MKIKEEKVDEEELKVPVGAEEIKIKQEVVEEEMVDEEKVEKNEEEKEKKEEEEKNEEEEEVKNEEEKEEEKEEDRLEKTNPEPPEVADKEQPEPETGQLVMTLCGKQKQLSFSAKDLLTTATMLVGDKVRIQLILFIFLSDLWCGT